MYSAVLMLALAGGSEAIDHGRRGCGGCNGAVYSGCTGTVYSGCTGTVYSGCTGTVYSGCTGTVYSGCTGCNGCRGGHGLFGRHRNNGCCGNVVYSCTGCVGGCGGVIVVPATPKTMVKPAETKKAELFVPATIIVNVPMNARLTVDGNPTSSTTERRSFVTPALQVGETYVYTLRAEVGTEAQSQQVIVRGGETSTVNFNFNPQGVASR